MSKVGGVRGRCWCSVAWERENRSFSSPLLCSPRSEGAGAKPTSLARIGQERMTCIIYSTALPSESFFFTVALVEEAARGSELSLVPYQQTITPPSLVAIILMFHLRVLHKLIVSSCQPSIFLGFCSRGGDTLLWFTISPRPVTLAAVTAPVKLSLLPLRTQFTVTPRAQTQL